MPKKLRAFDPNDVAYIKAMEKELKSLPPAKREIRRQEILREREIDVTGLAESFGGIVVDEESIS